MPNPRVAVLLLLALPACNLYSNCASARAVTEALREAATVRETQTIELARQLIEGRLKEVRERVKSEFAHKVVELRLNLHGKIEDKRRELSAMLKTQVATALDPILSQLHADLEQARQIKGDGAARLREYMLAAQHASTIAVASDEVFKLLKEVDTQLVALRTDLDQQLTALAGQADLVPGFEGQVEALFQQLQQQSALYQNEIDGAHQQLRRYFDTDDAPGLFFSGLSKGIGWNLNSLGDKADQLLEKGHNAINKWASEKGSQIEGALASKANGLLDEVARKISKG